MGKSATGFGDLGALQEADRRHHYHPFTDPKALVSAPPFMVERAEGVFIEGQGLRVLDAMAGLGCVNIGYGRPEMADAASEMMRELSFYHCFAGVSNPAAAALSERLAAIAPGDLSRVFYANSGSEANETIIKLVHMYWRRMGQPDRKIFISRDFSYHGSTVATSALNGLTAMHEPFGIETKGHVEHVDAPFWYRFGGDMSPEAFGIKAAASIEAKILEIGPDSIAAFIGEPIQATLGAIIPPEGYWPEVERICRKYGILMIADEVVTGFGRTGCWFGQQTFGFQADFMALAKGLSSGYQPIAAVLIKDEIADVLSSKPEVLQHGFTTSAHPVAAAVALKNIEIIEDEGLVTRVADLTGPYLATKLANLLAHPLVGEVRSCGMMAAVELAKNKETREQYPIDYAVCSHVAQAAIGQGLIVRPAGNVLIMCPPLTFRREHIDMLVRGLGVALDQVYAALKEQGLA